MVPVPGFESSIGKIPSFYMDRFEVTNREFKAFVDAGGYRDETFWRQPIVKDGKSIPLVEAKAIFVDRTGRPGPAGWEAGDYPEGEGEYPVTGISWYEAAAYAEFTGKSLPTTYHWGRARSGFIDPVYPDMIIRFSNFSGDGPDPVGKNPGITGFGLYDMAGNVSEWCWNETADGRVVRGGAWNDNSYMFGSISQASALERSPKTGFRCAIYPDPDEIPEKAFAPVTYRDFDISKMTPVSDEVFQVYARQFDYDEKDLNATVEFRDETAEDWIQEKVSFDAAYGGERVTAYLFLPRGVDPPYQTVIYVPGSTSLYMSTSEDMEEYFEFSQYLSYLVVDGRAVLYPVYKGTFERKDKDLLLIHDRGGSHAHRDFMIEVVKDFRRSVDYLETRPDIDAQKLAYVGMSWGGRIAPLILAVEDRIKVAALILGGTRALGLPEINEVNYIPRVKIPVLMLNGRYDLIFPYEVEVKPMYDLLGTPEEDKKQIVFETGHFVPRLEMARDIMSWLDRYLGPVGQRTAARGNGR
jgi:dienelactone hydrolase